MEFPVRKGNIKHAAKYSTLIQLHAVIQTIVNVQLCETSASILVVWREHGLTNELEMSQSYICTYVAHGH